MAEKTLSLVSWKRAYNSGYRFALKEQRTVSVAQHLRELFDWRGEPWPVAPEGKTYIYGLSDPRDLRVRYIGKADDPEGRYSFHLRDKRKSHKRSWVQSLLSAGLYPLLFVIEECDVSEWQARERYWIAHYKSLPYHGLTNGTAGGDGFYNPTPEVRAKHKASLAGRIISPEACANMSLALMGNKHTLGHKASEEVKARQSVAMKGQQRSLGYRFTPEQLARRSLAMIGNKRSVGHSHPQTQETREKIRISKKGKKQTPEHIANKIAARKRNRENRAAVLFEQKEEQK